MNNEFGSNNVQKHTLFVYGSLMKEGYNHVRYMADAKYLGKASVTGFDMYDLGFFPGVKHTKKPHVVLGELYEVTAEEFEDICVLEGNGSLYQCESVYTLLRNTEEKLLAEIFVYLGDVDESRKISGTVQSWMENERKSTMDEEYVWYACYGSNINRERFMRYINECSDTTPPVEDRPYTFNYPVMFGGKSTKWQSKGKAFLDIEKEGHALGRIYKITRVQYEGVKAREGDDYRHMVDLGDLDGIPVVSFTYTERPKRSIPSHEYFLIIFKGLQETYPEYRDGALTDELINGIFSAEEIMVLNCLRNAEHGLSNERLIEMTGMRAEEENGIISALIQCKAIRQDRRSSVYDQTDERAVFYTEPDERALIDRIRYLKQEAEELRNIPAADPLTSVLTTEGGRRQYLTTRYERVPANRSAAIRIHGLSCQVCGFNFYEHYGELGKDYIEVHHLRPLSSLREETMVDPATDLVCLCANCHRMMHRTRDHVMTVEELKRVFHA